MSTSLLVSAAVVFVAFLGVFALVLAAARISATTRRRRKLSALGGPGNREAGTAEEAMRPSFKSLVATLSKYSTPDQSPDDPIDKFTRAGLASARVRPIYYAAKTGGAILAPVAVFALELLVNGDPMSLKTMSLCLAAAGLGYYAPDGYISGRIAARQKAILLGLPDLLDLMVVCSEAGLGFDAAAHRVSRELVISHPVLAEEFNRMGLEMRAGAARSVALRNLAARVDIPEMSSLVAMLVQADKLGVSLINSLRTNADLLRVRRLTKAEELAAKIPVKITIPLFMFIFPTMFIVILGPAGIRVAGLLASR